MVPMAYAAEKAWRLKSWDKFVVPKPFSRIHIVVGQPIFVEKKLSKEALENIRQQAEQALNDALEKAQRSFEN